MQYVLTYKLETLSSSPLGFLGRFLRYVRMYTICSRFFANLSVFEPIWCCKQFQIPIWLGTNENSLQQTSLLCAGPMEALKIWCTYGIVAKYCAKYNCPNHCTYRIRANISRCYDSKEKLWALTLQQYFLNRF